MIKQWMNKKKSLKKKATGFTLLEMLIVLFIVAILMLLIVPNMASQRQKAQDKADEGIVHVVIQQEELYMMEHNTKTKPTLEQLVTEKMITPSQKEAYEKVDESKVNEIRGQAKTNTDE